MFQSSFIIKRLFYANIILFAFSFLCQILGIPFMETFALWDIRNSEFKIWQPISHMFMHGSFIHLFFNMFGLISFGPNVEREFSSRKFLIMYLFMGIFAAFFYMLFSSDYNTPMVGASGAIYGLFTMFTLYYPNSKVSIFPLPFSFKAKNLFIFFIVLEIILGISDLGKTGGGVAHFAHIGGAICGASIWFYNHKLKPKFFNG